MSGIRPGRGGVGVLFACVLAATAGTGCPKPAAPRPSSELELPEPLYATDVAPWAPSAEAPSSTAPPAAAVFVAPTVPRALRIYYLDVGQGDATLLVGPERSLLIDAGEQVYGKTEHYRKIAAAIRTATGRTSVDYALITHYHYDHMGGTRYNNGLWGLFGLGTRIGKLIDRGNFFVGAPTITGPGRAYLESTDGWLRDGKIGAHETARLGTDQIDLGGSVEVEIVAVNGNGILEKDSPSRLARCPVSENDYSVALVVRVGAFEAFFGGDIGGVDTDRWFGPKCMSYHDIETSVAPMVGNVEVMRANHHGSKHSNNPAFVATLRPELTIVSSGGYYHHPGREVVERLAPWGPILVTHAVSAKEWPDGTPMGVKIMGDMQISVDFGGARYWLDERELKAFDDAAEARGEDHPGRPVARAPVPELFGAAPVPGEYRRR